MLVDGWPRLLSDSVNIAKDGTYNGIALDWVDNKPPPGDYNVRAAAQRDLVHLSQNGKLAATCVNPFKHPVPLPALPIDACVDGAVDVAEVGKV